MKRILMFVTALALFRIGGPAAISAQSMDDLNLQVHGYATQGFIYSAHNNWNTTNSSDGSSAWTEAVVNVSAQPAPKLRIGVQARYSLLGSYGNQITLDWAEADVKVNEKFGFRVGKVKTPAGMLNETQDVDPAHLWILLPQSIYPLASRNSSLAHNGAVVYGRVPFSEALGKVDYRAYGGQRVVGGDDGYLQPYRDSGLTVPNGLTGRMFGGTLTWATPLEGLMVSASLDSENPAGEIASGSYVGKFSAKRLYFVYFSGRYEWRRVMLAGEYSRVAADTKVEFPGAPTEQINTDRRAFYVMTSYKLAEKLTAGIYYSSEIDLQHVVSSDRFSKDWTLSGRYDFNPYLYVKLEQHFMDGTLTGYSTLNNPGGLKPDTRMTLFKLGVTF